LACSSLNPEIPCVDVPEIAKTPELLPTVAPRAVGYIRLQNSPPKALNAQAPSV
jgi:hypothetical protein